MTNEAAVATHYEAADLEDRLLRALSASGIDIAALRAADLSPVDEFHLGGLAQTEAFCRELGVAAGAAVLDIGCGVGGPARVMAERFGARVDGIDLTEAFVRAATGLTRRVGLDGRVRFHRASAVSLPFGTDRFDVATMIHVGMNIEDKAALFEEVARVLRPGGRFGLYDIMTEEPSALPYPLPWASSPAISFVASREAYRRQLRDAGFVVEHERDRSAFVLEQAAAMRETIARDGPPRLGIHLVIGPDAKPRLANVMAALSEGLLAPVEMIARTA
ncbi:SAM-dependent methyltransferase [Marinivivus vitaminiproducens]|uniref:SAM-dependent methyltransferase n=1 Tax=Marinivivus vitaminiproducens TaxID=3035935 RepID=UPI0027A2611E|nr:methyltransferase domain-containing protein [Geminicoccaceae bacterium SCSIO 64248]